MTGKNRKTKPVAGQASREDRLKAALKANLGKRKAQARARTDDASRKEAE